MARRTSVPPRRQSRAVLPPAVTLAVWRVRQTWRLLLVTGVGMLAGVVLVCTAPLFSQVTLTAGLRDVLTATPQGSQVTLHAQARMLSTSIVAQESQALGDFMQQHVGAYLSGSPQFSIQLAPLHVSPFTPGDQIQLTGESMQASTAHLRLIQGQLPQDSGDVVEMAMTPDTVNDIHAHLGTEYTTTIDFFGSTAPIEKPLTLRLVGIFLPNADDPFWQGQTFAPRETGNFTIYNALMSNAGFLDSLTRVEDPNKDLLLNQPDIFWFYHLDVDHLKMADLDDVINRLNIAQIQLPQQFNRPGFLPGLQGAQLLGPPVEASGNPSTLEKFRDRVAVVQIPVDIVAFQVFFLVLFFVSIMADILVDRQAAVIALLRSRGASRWQIFGSFVNQSLGLSLIALVAGPLLAMLVTRWLTQLMLPLADQGALNVLDGNLLQVLGNVRWFALAAALGAVLAMIIAIRSSARRDVLEMRRESARVPRPPLWQRIYLDIVAAIIALTGFAISLYVTHAGVGDARTDLLIATPLALIAPGFLVIAGVLFFLRLFPLLMRPAARFAARRPQAAPMLALAQMARAPRQAMRMILLLALASSFAIFSLVFTATESQQILNVAANQVGADFSGQPSPSYQVVPSQARQTLAQLTATYRQIPGVLSATLGFVTDVTPGGAAGPVSLGIRAVDTQTFAQTAIWTDQDSPQSLASLMNQLRRASTAHGVPAIVDALAWRELQLSTGASFTLNLHDKTLVFIAVAQVQHIPTVNDSLDVPGTSDYAPPGGILVDFQELATAYQSQTALLPLNYLWLRTSDDPALLAKIRAALTAGPLQLATLNDRRAMIGSLQRDPLYLNLIAVLRLGAAVTVLLALVGNLIASWLGVRNRLLNFVVLRALGSSPRQIASVLVWEQGMIYTAALLLGVLFGALLVGTIVPALVFVGVPNNNAAINSGEFYVSQHVLPVQMILPSTLGLGFAGVVGICVAALWMMARVVSRPAISQTLRLSED